MSNLRCHKKRHPSLFPAYLKSQRGFTLIEMAIVVIIIGIVISIVAGVLPSLLASSKIKQARAQLETASNTLQGYSIANLRLPFADSNGDGVEDTGVFNGTLPYRTIGLSSGTDIWGNLIRYSVYGVSGGSDNLTQSFADANAFCTAISNASTTAFDVNIAHTTTASPCGGANGTNSSNQAYVLASGGLKNLDGVNGYWDDCNSATGAGFNIPGRIQDTSYDDLVRAYSLNELNQKNCSGSGGGGGGGTTAENTASGNCNDSVDNDGDGDTDCADSGCTADPACTGPSALNITTTSIPGGTLNSTSMNTIAASGGTTPYSWTLTSNGGFSDFSINSSTGTLSGTLDQCPSPPNYTVSVSVEDSTLPGDGGPFTDSENFTIQVTGNLAVNRTSGSGTTFDWTSASQQETFNTTGERLGTINWSLNTGGATGFSVVSTGNNTCRIAKSGSTTAGTYTFVLTATDASCASNTADLTLTVTVTSSGAGSPGNITGVVNTLEFYTQNMYDADIIHTSGDYYAIAFSDQSYRGRSNTVSINSSGVITSGTTRRFDYNNWGGETPDIIPVNGDIYVAAYTDSFNGGNLRTITINSSGQMPSLPDAYSFEWTQGEEPRIVHVTGTIYAVTYQGRTGGSDDGWIQTLTIQTSGNIGSSYIDRYEFDTSRGVESSIVQVSGSVFAIAYSGTNSDGFVKTLTIDNSGNITDFSPARSLEFDTGTGREPVIVHVTGDIFAIAYRGPGDDGWIKTVSIDSSGNITDTGYSLEFDNSYCEDPDLIQLQGDIFVVAYEGPNEDGWTQTLTIDSSGVIASTGTDGILEFDNQRGTEPSLVRISDTMFAVAYTGVDQDGFIRTIAVE